MLTLIEKGMTREQAYDLVQPKTAQSWDNQVDFKPLLEADPEVTSRLTQEEIDEIFNPVYYTKRVDEIFERIGLGDWFIWIRKSRTALLFYGDIYVTIFVLFFTLQ